MKRLAPILVVGLFISLSLAWLNVRGQTINTMPPLGLPSMSGDAVCTIAGVCTVSKINNVDQTTAYTTYTPTVLCGSGTATAITVAGRSKTLGKTVFFSFLVTDTTNGTCAASLGVPLPSTAVAVTMIPCYNTATSLSYTGTILATDFTRLIVSSAFPVATGQFLVCGGHYEST